MIGQGEQAPLRHRTLASRILLLGHTHVDPGAMESGHHGSCSRMRLPCSMQVHLRVSTEACKAADALTCRPKRKAESDHRSSGIGRWRTGPRCSRWAGSVVSARPEEATRTWPAAAW